MLKKLMNKQVKLLVSSNSGIGAGISTSAGCRRIANSGIIIMSGILTSNDDQYFIEISNAEVLYMNVIGEQPIHEQHKVMYVNRESVISISNDD